MMLARSFLMLLVLPWTLQGCGEEASELIEAAAGADEVCDFDARDECLAEVDTAFDAQFAHFNSLNGVTTCPEDFPHCFGDGDCIVTECADVSNGECEWAQSTNFIDGTNNGGIDCTENYKVGQATWTGDEIMAAICGVFQQQIDCITGCCAEDVEKYDATQTGDRLTHMLVNQAVVNVGRQKEFCSRANELSNVCPFPEGIIGTCYGDMDMATWEIACCEDMGCNRCNQKNNNCHNNQCTCDCSDCE